MPNQWLLFLHSRSLFCSAHTPPHHHLRPLLSRSPLTWKRPWRCSASCWPRSTSCWPSSAPWKRSGPSPCETGATWPPSSWRRCRGRWSTPQASSNSYCLTSSTKIWRARITRSSYLEGTKTRREAEGLSAKKTWHTCTDSIPTGGSSLRLRPFVYHTCRWFRASLRKKAPYWKWAPWPFSLQKRKTTKKCCYLFPVVLVLFFFYHGSGNAHTKPNR